MHKNVKLMAKVIVLGSTSLISTSSIARYAKSCDQFQKNRIEALKITKTINSANELIIAVSVDKNTCTFKKSNQPIQVFWEMGKERSYAGIPCEEPLLKEIRQYFGYNNLTDFYDRSIKSLGKKTMIVSLPALSDFPRKVGSRDGLGQEVKISLIKLQNGTCKTKTEIILNNKETVVERIHTIIRFFSLKKIELYKNKQVIHTIN